MPVIVLHLNKLNFIKIHRRTKEDPCTRILGRYKWFGYVHGQRECEEEILFKFI